MLINGKFVGYNTMTFMFSGLTNAVRFSSAASTSLIYLFAFIHGNVLIDISC